MSITLKLTQFFWSKEDRSWLDSGPLILYVRKGPVALRGHRYQCFTLASCQTHGSGGTHTGRLRPVFEFMDRLLDQQLVDVLKVESVISDRMMEILRKNEWCPDPSTGLAPNLLGCSWWKLSKQVVEFHQGGSL